MIHDLKIWPDHFQAQVNGKKNFEIRYDDRGFRVGDTLRLREWDPHRQTYTGMRCHREICHIASGIGLLPGWVVLGTRKDGAP